MSDDKHISIIVQATQGIRALNQMGTALNNTGSAVGRTDAQLKRLDSQLDKAAGAITKAASTMAKLKTEINEKNKQLTTAGNSYRALENRLATANKRLAENRDIIRTQKQVIKEIIRENAKLAGTYNDVAGAAAKAANAQRAGQDKYHGGAPVADLRAAEVAKQNAAALKASADARQQELRGMRQHMQASWGVQKAGNDAAKGVRNAASAVDELGQNVQQNALRYQLYDVAATLGIMGSAAMAVGVAASATAISWDKNFANVVRTSQVTGKAVEWLKEEFLELQSIIPVTSEDLATIATLGAQMGVAASHLANFTEIVAKFSSASGMSVDESATALSRLDELLPDVAGNYERLGSTILRTGVNAVATEQQIVRGTNQIASMGQMAGLTTPQVVALSSAMSSLGFSPELQRSIITSSFSRIMTATSQVTDTTERFGAVLNMTGKQFQEAWREDAMGTFTRFVESVAKRGDAVTVLQDLKLASQRLTPNLLKLGQNTGLLREALADTTDEWGKNTEMTRQYNITARTVSARIQVLGQSWEALLVTLDGASPVIGAVVDGLTSFIRTLRNVAKIPGVSTIAAISGAVVTLTGVLALGAAGLAGMSAGYIAITNAQRGLLAMTTANTSTTILNTSAKTANTTAKGFNTGATIANTAALSGNTGALAGNTIAAGVNAGANSKAGDALLGFSSKAISGFGAILKWTTIIGVATAALGGFIALAATSADWGYDLEKAFNGIKSPLDSIDYGIDEIDKAVRKNRELTEEIQRLEKAEADYLKSFDQTDDYNARSKEFVELNGRRYKNPNWREPVALRNVAGAVEKQLSESASRIDAIYRDLETSITDIETPEDQFRALNAASKELGITTEELLERLPDLASMLGEGAANAAAMVEEVDRLKAAQELWAIRLGISDKQLDQFQSGMASAAQSFLGFGSALSDAYEVNDDGVMVGGGLSAFLGDVDKQIADFETFYGKIQELVQKGGMNLATFFAEQGPSAMQAVTDALKLSDDQIYQIEGQFALAAFYASEEFVNTFSQNNAILADVFRKSKGNHEAVAAFNEVLNEAMLSGGTVDPAVIAQLSDQFFPEGIGIDISMIPTMTDEDKARYHDELMMLGATTEAVEFKVSPNIDPDGKLTLYRVTVGEEEMMIPVHPETEEGMRLIRAWRESEFQDPMTFQALLDRAKAEAEAESLRRSINATPAHMRVVLHPDALPSPGAQSRGGRVVFATGGMVQNGRAYHKNYPGYANGTIVRGPGTGTSDSILARISNGEAITRARAVRYYGSKMMEDINNMRFPRYATGFTPQGMSGSAGGPQQVINATVVQNYPTTQDPIKAMKQDAEAVLAGIWT